jgi:hypothetical protein
VGDACAIGNLRKSEAHSLDSLCQYNYIYIYIYQVRVCQREVKVKKGKVVPVLNLIKHHAMKAYCQREVTGKYIKINLI